MYACMHTGKSYDNISHLQRFSHRNISLPSSQYQYAADKNIISDCKYVKFRCVNLCYCQEKYVLKHVQSRILKIFLKNVLFGCCLLAMVHNFWSKITSIPPDLILAWFIQSTMIEFYWIDMSEWNLDVASWPPLLTWIKKAQLEKPKIKADYSYFIFVYKSMRG